MKASNIYAEEEVEYDLRIMMDVVKKTLETMCSQETSARFELWRTPFFDTRVTMSSFL